MFYEPGIISTEKVERYGAELGSDDSFDTNVLATEASNARQFVHWDAGGEGRAGVEVAGAESVATANVFHGLRFSSYDGVSCPSAGDCCEGSSGAEKKALDVHF
jgi:hypothetical protein